MSERPGQIGDFWLSKRPGSQQWCRTWYEAGQTKRSSLATADLEQAKLALLKWFQQHGKLSAQAPEKTSVVVVLSRYFERKARGSASEDVARVAIALWGEFFAGCTVADLRAPRQREFHAWLRAKKKKNGEPFTEGYIKRLLGVGAAAIAWATKEGELDSAPFILPGVDGEPRDRVLTVAESKRLWEAARHWHEYVFLALAYGTLARPEAILDLTREQVDFERGLIQQNAPGRKQTKKYRPVVPLAPILRPWLENAPAGPLVRFHGKPIASFKTSFRRMRAAAGLGTDVVAKTIRHTMATELRANGVPEAEIQGFLGHRAYGGKTEIYAKYRPDYLGQAVGVIEGYVGKVRAERASRVLVSESGPT